MPNLVQGPLLLAAAFFACCGALPHGSGWVPSGAWSSPTFSAVSNPWPAQGWTDYSVSVDPWATQVVKKKPSYASLYPWPEKPVYRSVPIHHVPAAAAPSYTPQPQSGGYAGWTRIPVLDEEGGNQWVAWVPEELGDFVIVRKDKLKPKKKKVEEEEEEEPEPAPRPKPKKKVKTIVEEEAPEEEPPKPKKKVKTIVEEEAPDEEPKPKKKTKVTVMEDEVPPKKTTKTTVTTEEQADPGSTTVKETSSTSSDTRVTKTEVIEQAATAPVAVSVPAPTN